MTDHTSTYPFTLRSHRSAELLPREEQLAWKFAERAASAPVPTPEVVDMVANRIIDNAAVAVASLYRSPVQVARDQALSHLSGGRHGSTVFGLAANQRFSPEWAAWANGVAVRELDFHDTFLAADYSHPGDNIPALIAVAQHRGIPGDRLARAIAIAYEVQVTLVKGVCLHEHKIDHIAHLGPFGSSRFGCAVGCAPRSDLSSDRPGPPHHHGDKTVQKG